MYPHPYRFDLQAASRGRYSTMQSSAGRRAFQIVPAVAVAVCRFVPAIISQHGHECVLRNKPCDAFGRACCLVYYMQNLPLSDGPSAAASTARVSTASCPLKDASRSELCGNLQVCLCVTFINVDRCHTASPSLAQKLAAERRTQSILQQQAGSTASTPTKGGLPVVPNVGNRVPRSQQR